jgi:hypothetical protein
MYGSSTYGANLNNPPLTNNPFIESTSHPSSRYPDLSAPTSQPQSQWTDPTLLTGLQPQYQPDIYQQYPPVQQIPSGYPPQPPQFQVPIQPQIQPPNYPPPFQQPPPQQPSLQPTAPFQPSSSFGQTLQSSMSGGGYGYLQSGQPQPPQQQHTTPAYNPAQQLNNPNYVAQLDPYGPISQGWATDTTTTPQSQQSLSQASNNNNNNFGYGNNQNNMGYSPSGEPHPRDYIRSHKQDIEAWDQYTWKQLLNSCEALKRSWESKRNELKTKLAGLQSQHRYAGYYDRTQIQQEGGRIQAVS